ncbi:TPA: enoyl-CoA hydratase/isomerase family protein, partial [Escherichia coli]|nr:enoyl-CoA hydratase/isomerase family protein [Escherichia coli]
MNTENHLMIERQGKLGVITLDRVTHLNALSLDMIEGIGAQLELWRNDAAVQA